MSLLTECTLPLIGHREHLEAKGLFVQVVSALRIGPRLDHALAPNEVQRLDFLALVIPLTSMVLLFSPVRASWARVKNDSPGRIR
jgi:hypothetical protein